jgi:hypothetical protein
MGLLEQAGVLDEVPQVEASLAEAMNRLRRSGRTAGWVAGFRPTATNVVGTEHTFDGDDIGDYSKRMAWIRAMADSLVQARFEAGHERVANFNQGLLE